MKNGWISHCFIPHSKKISPQNDTLLHEKCTFFKFITICRVVFYCSALKMTQCQSVQLGGATGRTYLMPTLFSQPIIKVSQSPWKIWPRHWISQEWRSSWLGLGNATLWKKGDLIQLSQDVVGYLRNPDLVFVDRSTSQRPPLEPLENGRGDLQPSLSCSFDFLNVVSATFSILF